MLYEKGEVLMAFSTSPKNQVELVVPHANMCEMLLTRYLVMELGEPVAKYTFVQQRKH